MRFTLDPAFCWWTVPIPVKRSQFAAMDPSHDRYNVETDLAAIGAFSLTANPPAEDALYADLQTLPRGNVWRRLGSGRAGFYQGAYLKGMGRTSLAGNWADAEDRYHSSGHLLPSAAVREYLVSRALAALDEDAAIVPCTGLLVRELDAPIDSFLHAMLPEAEGRFADIDRRMQAITVKKADFARFSNFVWALDHIGRRDEIADVMFRVHATLLPPGARPDTGASSSPEAIAAALASAIERAVDGFASYARAGVFWGSFTNNFTADGRFLDLEVPMALLQPFFGIVGEGERGLSRDWAGLEVLSYLRQAAAFVTWLVDRLSFLACHVLGGIAHEFAAALVAAVKEALPPAHLLWSRPRQVDLVVAAAAHSLDLSERARTGVREIAELQHDVVFLGKTPDWSHLRFVRVPAHIAAAEPGVNRWFATPDFLADACATPSPMGLAFNDGLRWIEASGSAAELFERTRSVARGFAPPTMELAS
jgi:hypothetical protein